MAPALHPDSGDVYPQAFHSPATDAPGGSRWKLRSLSLICLWSTTCLQRSTPAFSYIANLLCFTVVESGSLTFFVNAGSSSCMSFERLFHKKKTPKNIPINNKGSAFSSIWNNSGFVTGIYWLWSGWIISFSLMMMHLGCKTGQSAVSILLTHVIKK